MQGGYIYIMSNRKHGPLYVGPAIRREKNIKDWPRAWKVRLIEKMNPEWEDLYPTLF